MPLAVRCAALVTLTLALGSAGPVPRPAAPPDPVAVENLAAFARLYGLVRFFHPSDEAAAVDWNRFAVLGAERVAGAATPADLADSLRALFGPIAPSVAIAVGDAREDVLPEGERVVTWQHVGVRLSDDPNIYQSVRLGRPPPGEHPQFGAFVQSLDAAGLRGRRVRLSAAVRAEVGRAQVWLRVDREGQQMGHFDNMQDRPVTASTWARYAIEGPVAEDAVGLVFGGIVPGAGAAVFDAFRLEVEAGDGRWTEVPLVNGSFESGTEGWGTNAPGYAFEVDADPADGAGALRLAALPSTTEGLAAPLFEQRSEVGEAAVREIGRGLTARVPLALPSRAGRTLPAADADALDRLRQSLAGVALSAGDGATRVADVIVAWSVFQHFYPYSDVVDVDWGATLDDALRDALAAEESSCAPLQRMVSRLRDGHGQVGCTEHGQRAVPAFAVERVEDQVVVVATADTSRFRPGDVVVSVDGADARGLLDSLAAVASGSPQWRERRASWEFGAGPAESTARVVLDRDGRRIDVDAPRTLARPPEEDRPDPISEIETGVFYLDIQRVREAGLDERIDEIAAAEGVVVDFRGYPTIPPAFLAHFADRPVSSALWEVPQIVSPDWREAARYDTSRWAPLAPAEPHVQGRVAFLTDARAISYAESILGIVDHYGLGTTVGGPTAGANGNINPFYVPGGHRIVWTGMRVRRHDGGTLFGVGLEPDVPVERTIAGIRAGRDEVLERGIETVTGER